MSLQFTPPSRKMLSKTCISPQQVCPGMLLSFLPHTSPPSTPSQLLHIHKSLSPHTSHPPHLL